MVKIHGFAAAIVMAGASFVTPAFAITLDAAVEQCALVAGEEQRADSLEDHQYRGYCITATADYLTTLTKSGLSQDELGVELATYVVRLTELLKERFCKPDSEIPQAIAMTGDASLDPEQAEQIRLISLATYECAFSVTAAVATIPDFPGVTTGGSASEN
jgi:hypothetical protein